jgi:hypothetical protein
LELARPFGGDDCGNTEKLVAIHNRVAVRLWKMFFATRFFGFFLRNGDGFGLN